MESYTKRNLDVRKTLTGYLTANLDSVVTMTMLQAREIEVQRLSDGLIQIWITPHGSSTRVCAEIKVSIPI